jgi:putative tryptophan/tyrosine transport system substrate-binding protein
MLALRRREFIALLGAASALPQRTGAQPRQKVRRVGVLTGNVMDDPDAQTRVQAFRKGLADLGWFEERNVRIDVRWPGPDVARQQSDALELVATKPEIIVTTSTPTTRAMKAATETIPVVFVGLSDPIATGVVSNLARPEGNVTGFMLYEHSLAKKWLNLLKTVAPAVSQVAVFFNPDTSPYAQFYVKAAQEEGERLGLKVTAASVRLPDEIDPAIAPLTAASANGGLMVLPDGGFTARYGVVVIALAAKYRVPAIYAVRFYAINGGLMSYGADLTRQFYDGAAYVDRILRGAKPIELPVQFATNFQLSINIKVANALGLTVPRHLIVGAELIQ